MINGFYTKNEVVRVKTAESTTDMTSYNVKITTEIMKNVTSRISLIEAIEAYNEDHKLPYNKRIRYSIAVSNVYIAVLKAYKLSETEICVIGWDQNGYPSITYNDKGAIEKAMAGISTHVIKIDNINDVVIGNYDSTKIGNIFTYETVDEISEKELLSKLNRVIDSMTTLICSGYYRSALEKFTYEFNRNKFNSYSYEHKNVAYTKYVELYAKYILMLKDIVGNSLDSGRITYTDTNSDNKIHNRFEFIESDDEIDDLLKVYYREARENTEIFKKNYDTYKRELMEKTFTTDELNTFKQLIDFDHLKLDENGNPYWVE